jgi:hypothetical protein
MEYPPRSCGDRSHASRMRPEEKTQMTQWLKLKNKITSFTMRLTLIFDLIVDSIS